MRQHLIKRCPSRTTYALIALHALTIVGHFPGTGFVFNDNKNVTCFRRAVQTKHLYRLRRSSAFNAFAAIINECANFTPFSTCDEDIANRKRAALNKQRAHWAPTLVELRFHDHTLTRAFRVCFQFKNFRLKHDGLFQLVQTCFGVGRNFNRLDVATHVFYEDFVLEKLVLHTLRFGRRFVALVDSDNDRHLARFGVIDRFNGLRHHTIVGRDHKDHNVCCLRTTSPHGGKGFMAWRVKESDLVTRSDVHLIGTNVLGDATGFTCDDICLAKRIKQGCLTMVNVTHHSDNRCTRLFHFIRVVISHQTFFNVCLGNTFHRVS